jgi:hypothetical protein
MMTQPIQVDLGLISWKRFCYLVWSNWFGLIKCWSEKLGEKIVGWKKKKLSEKILVWQKLLFEEEKMGWKKYWSEEEEQNLEFWWEKNVSEKMLVEKNAVNSGHFALPLGEILVFSNLMSSPYCTSICSALEHFQSRWFNINNNNTEFHGWVGWWSKALCRHSNSSWGWVRLSWAVSIYIGGARPRSI